MSYWDGKRVCVTGGAGFLGGHLLEELARRGATGGLRPSTQMLTFRAPPWIIGNPSR